MYSLRAARSDTFPESCDQTADESRGASSRRTLSQSHTAHTLKDELWPSARGTHSKGKSNSAADKAAAIFSNTFGLGDDNSYSHLCRKMKGRSLVI
jgi:hypothetical protein